VIRFKSEDEIQEAMNRSSRSLFMDNRSKEQIKKYEAEQAKNRRRNATRKQYLKYKARLGDDGPKTLSSFSRMKNANSKGWQELQLKYRKAGEE
jgi:hypothetical protein